MVAETSETSKDQKTKVLPVKTTRARARVAKSAASENNTCTCRICNLISAEKATFQREKCPAISNGLCPVCVHPIRDALG